MNRRQYFKALATLSSYMGIEERPRLY